LLVLYELGVWLARRVEPKGQQPGVSSPA